MKKFLYANLCLLLTATLWLSACGGESEPPTSSSFSPSSSDTSSVTPSEDSTTNFKYAIDGSNASIIGLHDESVSSVVIPSLIEDNGKAYSVTSIGDNAFQGCSNLTSITIPDSVTSIGSSAFSGCSSLESITLPFVGSSKTVTSASSSTLFGYIFGSDSYIGGVATMQFYGGSSGVAYQIYYIPSSLRSIAILNGVTSIGDNAFQGCSNLTSITIPNSVTSIGISAFNGCKSLTSITIPDSVTSINSSAFSGCSNLTSITIPDSVTSIGSSAFGNCDRLVEVINKSTLDIIVGSSDNGLVAYYAKQVIKDESESKLSTDENGFVTYNDGTDIWLVNYVGNEKKVVIPSNVTKINDYVFYCCSNLTSITIPNSVTSIGDAAFFLCSNLTSITIPNSVTSIGIGAFNGCKSLTSITIPDSVTSISFSVFSDCSSLTSITIPNSVTSIDDRAFSGCPSLTSITIPNSVTSVGVGAFNGCKSLTSITIGSSVTSIGDRAFSNCSSLTKVYYKGNKPYTSTITNIGTENNHLVNATWYYFTKNGDSETTQGNWWYYDTDGVTVIEKVVK